MDGARAVPSADGGPRRDTTDVNRDIAPGRRRHAGVPHTVVLRRQQVPGRSSGSRAHIRIPGTNVALYIGGFAQLDVLSDPQTSAETRTSSWFHRSRSGPARATPGSTSPARQSRVFIETDAPWSVAPLMAYVEVDFFDPQNQNVFHIRHAFGAIGRPNSLRLIGGQTWSSFMDATIIPNQLDYAGPVGIANVQQAQARLIVPLPIGLEGLLAIEAPDPQITLPMNTTGTGYSRWPDLIATLRWDHGHGHLQLSGVFRQIGNLDAMGDGTSRVGYGGNFTGRLAGFWGKDQFLWSVGAGRAVARYFAGSNGLNQDAFLELDGQLVAAEPRRGNGIVHAHPLGRPAEPDRDLQLSPFLQPAGRHGHDVPAVAVRRRRAPVLPQQALHDRHRVPVRATREQKRGHRLGQPVAGLDAGQMLPASSYAEGASVLNAAGIRGLSVLRLMRRRTRPDPSCECGRCDRAVGRYPARSQRARLDPGPHRGRNDLQLAGDLSDRQELVWVGASRPSCTRSTAATCCPICGLRPAERCRFVEIEPANNCWTLSLLTTRQRDGRHDVKPNDVESSLDAAKRRRNGRGRLADHA